jgi:uncharacterized protein (TIGR03067 family)
MRQVTSSALAVAFLCFWAACPGGARPQDDEESRDKELRRLEGTWLQVSVQSNGQTQEFVPGTAPRLVIRGSLFEVKVDGKVLQSGKLSIDSRTKPFRIDQLVTEGTGKERIYPGIYKLTGDELRMCVARDDVARPTDFTAGAGSGLAVQVYRRVTPKK